MELWDVLDYDGNPTGRTHVRDEPMAEGDYHLIVDVWIQNALGEYLITKRAPGKFLPNLWEPTTGCAIQGDTSLSAALRETLEETGIALKPENGKLIGRFHYAPFNTILDVWLFRQNCDLEEIVLQPGETVDAMWATANTVKSLIREGRFLGEDRMFYLKILLEA